MSAPLPAVPARSRPAVWCPGTHPTCPNCGSRLYVAVDRNQSTRGLCRNRADGKRCEQHYIATGIGGDVTVVLALTPDEFHALAAGRKIAGVKPEGVTWAPRG